MTCTVRVKILVDCVCFVVAVDVDGSFGMSLPCRKSMIERTPCVFTSYSLNSLKVVPQLDRLAAHVDEQDSLGEFLVRHDTIKWHRSRLQHLNLQPSLNGKLELLRGVWCYRRHQGSSSTMESTVE